LVEHVYELAARKTVLAVDHYNIRQAPYVVWRRAKCQNSQRGRVDGASRDCR